MVAKEVASAREGAEREARESYRIREEEIERAKAAIEGELAATRRQLDEAHDRALAAERRATQIETETRQEVERERELRFKAIEGRIGEVTDMASGATERARATDVGSPSAAPPTPAEPEPEPAPEP